ncbi:solute carrier organic anion transporter family member 2B1 [Anolis carolinensis]|uniref:solute carrier organic anion transporter family member 2B1 n=1 Tax=Anolis carolinensis TaxID=28377 RepID=UPI000462CB62|nr:PREDICTED: solute carrier organic anion transporter family member 2B1 [Anolis carolinensis]|eukprot:XP_008119912.1 PREDICTED: solute carrier organic anion transporter family member 2B1 [Anolis carolinensis]
MSDDEGNNGLFHRFSCANPFHTIKFFVFCQSFLQLTQLMTSSYMRSTISTIEKRFGLSSQTSGLLVSFNEVGNTLLIIFVSYFGSRVHRPRFIGYGAILVALSGLITSLPHFLIGPYEYDRTISETSSNLTDMCLPGHKGTSVSEVCTSQVERSSMVLGLLFLGQTLLGIGGVPIQPFGISYIDDFASKSNSPLYIGILFATTTMGPALAFIVGSVMLRFYVDIDKFSAAEIHINNKDPRWVGAWWLGFILTASIVAISSIPYFFFPRELPKEEEVPRKTIAEMAKAELKEELRIKHREVESLPLKQFIKLFPMIFFRTIKNPIFAVVIFALFNLSGMIAGLATFMAKFLEQQFTLTASLANMIIGAVQLPSGMMGIILGGAIMKNCHLSLRYATIMCIFGLALCVLFDIPLLFLGCPTHAVAGLDPSGSSGPEQLFADCNRQCNCSSSGFNPVCGQNNIEYVTPCFAGCSGLKYNAQAKKILNYTMCNCIIVDGALGYAVPGSCGGQCSRFLLPFVMITCISGFMACLSHTPAFVMVLRSVKPEDKSFAIGIQFMLLRVLAWLPAPVLYGSAIDMSCLLWQMKCKKRAACRYYNNTAFRQRYIGIQIVYEFSCLVAFCVLYYLFQRQEKQEQEEMSRDVSSQVSTETRT